MSLVFIGLGSNLGDGQALLKQAWQRLGQEKAILPLALSSPYLTEPVGMVSENWFTNAVGVLETSLSAHELLSLLLATEASMGRDRRQGQDRPIDLDILYYDEQVMADADLTIPHPGISQRLFVLAPLTELAPDHLHPQLQVSSRAMKQALLNHEQVTKTSWE